MSGTPSRKRAQRARARKSGHQNEKVAPRTTQPIQAPGPIRLSQGTARIQKTTPPAQAARYVRTGAFGTVTSQNNGASATQASSPHSIGGNVVQSTNPEVTPAARRWRSHRTCG